MKSVGSLAVLLLTCFVLGACGGDDSAGEPGPAVDSSTGRLASLKAAADVILVGRLESSLQVSSASGNVAASTAHTLRVVDLLSGPLRANTITVRQPASPAEPEWTRGATYVLFLKQTTGIDRYEVLRGAEGRLLVASDGLTVSSLSRAPSGSQLEDLGIDREPLDDFKTRVRSLP